MHIDHTPGRIWLDALTIGRHADSVSPPTDGVGAGPQQEELEDARQEHGRHRRHPVPDDGHHADAPRQNAGQ